MKRERSYCNWLRAGLIAGALTVSAFAQEAKKEAPAEPQHHHQTELKEPHRQFMGQGDGVETCPVTGDKITSKEVKGQFFGRTVYFCCEGCLDDAKKSPSLYLKPTFEMQVAAVKEMQELAKSGGHHHHGPAAAQEAPKAEVQEAPKGEPKFLGKGDGIEMCPVMGSPVDKTLKFEWKGQTYYVCCESCLDTLKKSPEQYLRPPKKAEAAPQPAAQPAAQPAPQPAGDHHDHEKPATASKFLGIGDGIETCPVTGDQVDKSIKVDIAGRTVYACCPPCIDTIKKNPELYLKKQ